MKKEFSDLLIRAFSPTYLSVNDESALHAGHRGISKPQESHFRIKIVSSCFKNKTLLFRHRLIYQALEPIFQNIHAVAISAYTPEEWDLTVQSKEINPEITED